MRLRCIPWLLLLVILSAVAGCQYFHAPAVYPRTDVGVTELKTIPELTRLTAQAPGDPFENRDETFMMLFRYIDRNEISMTTPVEMETNANRMAFIVPSSEPERRLESSEEVHVSVQASQTVVSTGLRGSYTRERYEKGLTKVREWLERHPQWSATGDPYAVYWNSPYTPAFLRKSEVHQPVVSNGESDATQ